MLEGDNDTVVTESYLLWLEETAAPKIGAEWAQQKEAVSQVGIPSIDQTHYLLVVSSFDLSVIFIFSGCFVHDVITRSHLASTFLSQPTLQPSPITLIGDFLHQAVNNTSTESICSCACLVQGACPGDLGGGSRHGGR